MSTKMKYCTHNNHLNLTEIKTTKNYTWFFCRHCHLLFCDKKNNNHKIFKTRLKIFNNFNDGNKYEFLSILEKVKKIYFKKKIEWLDYGCGSGGEIKILNDKNINAIGFEPNPTLFQQSLKKKIKVFNKLSKINSNKKFDIIFTKNTFKYIDSFPLKISELSSKIKKNGLFVWRDKFFDFFPQEMNNLEQSLTTGSYLFKKTILYFLSLNNLKIVEVKFYLDSSFLIIAKKTGKISYNKNIQLAFIQEFLIRNQFILKLIHGIRKILHKLFLRIRNSL